MNPNTSKPAPIPRLPDLDKNEVEILRRIRGQIEGEDPPNLYRLEHASGVNRAVIHRHLVGPLRRKPTLEAREYVRLRRTRKGGRELVLVELELKGEVALYLDNAPGFRGLFLRKYSKRWTIEKAALRAYLDLFFAVYFPTQEDRTRWWLPVPVPDIALGPGFNDRMMWHLQEPLRILSAFVSLRALLWGGASDPRQTTVSPLPPAPLLAMALAKMVGEDGVRAIAADLKRRQWIRQTERDLRALATWVDFAAKRKSPQPSS